MLPLSVKDKAPVLDTSKYIDEFTCICESEYIVQTERCLSTQIKQHLPRWPYNSVEKTLKNTIMKILLISDHSVDAHHSFEVFNKQCTPQLSEFTEGYQPNLCI